MAAAALFLAAKVEEQPRQLGHVIKVADPYAHCLRSRAEILALSLMSLMMTNDDIKGRLTFSQ